MIKIRKGFTLIELLVVIGIIGILAAIVLVAVNPGRQFAQARNTQRQSDLLAITNAVFQFAAENDGNLPATGYLNGAPTVAGAFPTCSASNGSDATEIGGTAGFDLAAAGASNAAGDGVGAGTTISPTYIAEVPTDPSGPDATTGGTRYYICVMDDTTTTPGRVFARGTDELTQNDITVLR